MIDRNYDAQRITQARAALTDAKAAAAQAATDAALRRRLMRQLDDLLKQLQVPAAQPVRAASVGRPSR